MESGVRQLTYLDLNQFGATQVETLGALGSTGDGRLYKYVKFGGTATINPGLLVVGPVAPANSTALAITATGTGGQVAANLVAGSQTLVVTNGATAVTVNEFDYVEVMVGGTLPLYSIKLSGNSAAAASGYVTLYLDEPLPQGTTTLVPGTDTVNLVLSKYNGVTASTTGNVPVGVTVNVIPNTASVTNYGWVQSAGKAVVKATTATIGLGIAQDMAGTPGYVIISAATTGNLGWAKTSAASGNASVELSIA